MKTDTAKQDQTKTEKGKITAIRQYAGGSYGVYHGESWHDGLQLVKSFGEWIDAKELFDKI